MQRLRVTGSRWTGRKQAAKGSVYPTDCKAGGLKIDSRMGAGVHSCTRRVCVIQR